MGLRNIQVTKLKRTPTFRKIALATWDRPGDPQIYGTMEVDLTKAYAWRDKLPEGAPKITVTHMVTRAMARAMKKHPDLNGFVRFRKIILRKNVDLALLATVEDDSGQQDLSSVKLRQVDEMSTPQIAEMLATKLKRIRDKKDTDLQKSSKLMSYFPGWIVRFLLWFTAFVSYTLNIRFPGVPKDPFAACIITNVGMFGLDIAYAPLVPYTRAPMVLLVGQAKLRPTVDDKGQIVARHIVTLNASIDHAFCDGALLANMVKVIQETFANPDEHFGQWIPPETNGKEAKTA